MEDSFSDKVLLSEIQKIKAALQPDDSLADIAGTYGDAASDEEEKPGQISSGSG